MAKIDADIWVLTEAHINVSPGSSYELVARSTRDDATDPNESWVAIWSRLGGTQVGTSDADRTAAAVVTGMGSRRLVIYGTVLPSVGSTWRDVAAAGAYAASLAGQAADWAKFASNSHLCVVGDLNQDLLTTGKMTKNRAALKNALNAADLDCVTAEPKDLVQEHTAGKAASVDHICVTGGLAPQYDSAIVWPAPDELTAQLSDHFGVSIRLSAM